MRGSAEAGASVICPRMSHRRIADLRVVALVATAIAMCGCSAPSGHHSGGAGSSATAHVVGETYFPPGARRNAPALSGDTLLGSRYALTQARGRVLVVNVWASWCEPCRKESRGLGRLSAALSSKSVSFVGIDEHDTDGSGRAFANASGTTYPQLVDPDGALLARLTLLPGLGIPSTLVIDRYGRMAARIIGPADETVLRKLIERVAADH